MAAVRDWSAPPTDRPAIIGHRGIPALETENTLASFSRALAEGADALEADVRLTRDGVPVCFHDDDLVRLNGERVPVSDLDFADLERVDSGILRLASLAAAIDGAAILLDMKTGSEKELRVVWDICAEYAEPGRFMFGAPTRDHLVQFEALGLPFPRCALLPEPVAHETLQALGVTWVRLQKTEYQPSAVDKYRHSGLKTITVANLNGRADHRCADLDSLASWNDLNVDGIILDNAGDAARYFT